MIQTLDVLKEGRLEGNIEQLNVFVWMDDRAGQGGMQRFRYCLEPEELGYCGEQ